MGRLPSGLSPLAAAVLASGALKTDVVAEIGWLKAQFGCTAIALSPAVWAEAMALMADPQSKSFSSLENAGLPAPLGAGSLWIEVVTSWSKGLWRRRILEGTGLMLGGLPERPGHILVMGVLVREGVCAVVPMLGTWNLEFLIRSPSRSSVPHMLRHMARSISIHDGVGMAKSQRLNGTRVGDSRDDARVFIEMQVVMQVALLLRAGATLTPSTLPKIVSAGELKNSQQERMTSC